MVTKMEYQAETQRADEAIANLRNAEDRIAELEFENGRKTEHILELRQRTEQAQASSKRAYKRAAAANKNNEKLMAANKALDWRIRQLEIERGQDAWHARQLELMAARLKLIREVSAPLTSADYRETYVPRSSQ